MTFLNTLWFFMSSYVFYSYALRENIQGLNKVGMLGRELGNNLTYAHVPQITIHQYQEHYYRINDVFSMRLVKIMEGDKAKILSLEAQSVIGWLGVGTFNFLLSPTSGWKDSKDTPLCYPGIQQTKCCY